MPQPVKIKRIANTEFQTVETPFPRPERIFPGIDQIDPETFPDFLDEIGLVGMGGSGVQTSEKIRAAIGAHTLVINGIGCEPGITIDQAVLIDEFFWVAAGANACARAVGATRIILAVKNDSAFISKLRNRSTEFEIIGFPPKYPAGAEKLIIKKLTGKMLPPGTRPTQFGFLVLNVVSLRAVGRAIVDGIPVVERPLTLSKPASGFTRNLIVPVGITVRELFGKFLLPYDPEVEIIVESGIMMGRAVELDNPIEKTTLSLMVLPRDIAWRTERPCTRCGACNTACPLGLHPFSLTELIRKRKTRSKAFKTQMAECFLCGICSAACPSGIPLVQSLEKGKECL